MQYAKRLMSISELIKLGYSENYLRRMTHHKLASKYIRRTSNASNAKVMFDTEQFEKLIQNGKLR